MYQLIGSKLRVAQSICNQNKQWLQQCRLIFYHHLFPDTVEFIEHLLAAGATIDVVIGKEYTSKSVMVKRLRAMGLRVLPLKYEMAEKGEVLRELLLSSLRRAGQEGQKVIINEVGGYFSTVLPMIPVELLPYLGGVVEVTTYGLRKYQKMERTLPCPVYHVARSKLKAVEASYVGQAWVCALDQIMRDMGVSMSGREILVVGYGMVGSQIAKALKAADIHVTILDVDPIKRLQAYVDGFRVIELSDDLTAFDLIVSATGRQAVPFGDDKAMPIRRCFSQWWVTR